MPERLVGKSVAEHYLDTSSRIVVSYSELGSSIEVRWDCRTCNRFSSTEETTLPKEGSAEMCAAAACRVREPVNVG